MNDSFPNNPLDKFQEIMRREDKMMRIARGQIGPQLANLANLPGASSILGIDIVAQRYQDALKGIVGPIDELTRMHLAIQPNALTGLHDTLRAFNERFSLPLAEQARQLLGQFDASGAISAMRRLQDHTGGIQHAIDAMRVPWLDAANQLGSIGSFVELQRIGLSLQSLPTFDSMLTDSLRIDLGDWRDTITLPKDIFSDVGVRTAFYESRGLNLGLTEFPAEAFQQSALLAGLAVEPPPLLKGYDRWALGSDDPEEAGFERTNAAHDRLQRFESQLRRFIEERMRDAFGEAWIKHNVPGEIRERWIEKRKKALEAGEKEWPLIAYADFTDYLPIITRKDNWEATFEPFFGRSESVRESFQRLYPIRLCTMHARIITQDDELYLLVETKRILSAIT